MSYVVAVALAAGGADILGGYIMLRRPLSQRVIDQLLAIAAGFLLGGALFNLLPEAMELEPRAPLYIALGYGALFVIGHLFAHHSHGRELHETHVERLSWKRRELMHHRKSLHPLVGEPHGPEPRITEGASWAALLGLSLHTFLDGAAIGAAFASSRDMGLLVFLAVVLHKLPEGFSVTAIMLAAGRSRLAAFLATLALASATIAGALSGLCMGSPGATGVFLALATGSFLYIGATDLIPVTTAKGKGHIALVFVGAALVYVMTTASHTLGFE